MMAIAVKHTREEDIRGLGSAPGGPPSDAMPSQYGEKRANRMVDVSETPKVRAVTPREPSLAVSCKQ